MNDTLRLLLVEDSDDDALLVMDAVRRHGLEFAATRVATAAGFEGALNDADWDVILCDYSMPGFDALGALEILRETGRDIPFIIVSGTIGEDVAVETLKHGANDYILKQNLTRLGPAVEHELRDAADRRRRRQIEAFSDAQGEVLESILEKRPLGQILAQIANRIESLPLSASKPLCSILLTDPEGTHLTLGAAPSLPQALFESYEKNPVPIEPGMGSPSAAAIRKENVVSEDIATEPDWENVRERVLEFGLKACWSVPIVSPNGELVGTVAMYYRAARRPADEEIKWVEAAVNLVILAVERSRTDAALREYQDRIRSTFAAASAGIAITTPDCGFIMANRAYMNMVGYSEEELVKRDLLSLVHPDDRPRNLASIRRLLDGEVHDLRMEERFFRKDGGVVWVSASVALVRAEDGRPENLIVVTEDITERKETEEVLSQKESLLRIAGRIAHLGGWEIDLDSNRVAWSDEVCVIHEVPPGTEISLEEGIEFYAPEFRDRIREVVQSCIREGVPYDEELQLITARDRRKWVRAIGQAVRDSSGAIVRVRGAIQDITERKSAAEEARKLAIRLRRTLESITDAFFTLDHEWRFTYMNSEAERLLKRRKEEILGLRVWDEFPEAVGSVFEREYHRAISDEVAVHFEEVYPALGLCFEVHAYPSEEGLAVYFHDITKRKEAEARLAEQAALLDKAQDAILVLDLDGVITFWNKSAERLYGWSAEEAMGADIRNLIYRDPKVLEKANQSVLDRDEWTGELQQIRKDGSQVTIQARWSLVRNDAGEPDSILAINTDITDSKRMEQQFLRAQRMEGIGTLAGGIAHDLNNILSPIMMAAELLRQGDTGNDEFGLLETIETSAQRGADMIRQILSFARGSSGERIPTPPGIIINDVVRIVTETFPKVIDVETCVADDIHPIHGDPSRLNQVLLNLCINARDAMRGGGRLRISASNVALDERFIEVNREGSPGPHVLIEVSDTGDGIPADILPRIFDPFFTTKEQGKGTGLGLATVMNIVRSHKGFIRLDSDEGKGTTFKLYFPAIATGREAGSGISRAELPRGSGECILVIDDEDAVCEMTRQTLETFGYRVLLAGNGQEGLKVYQENRDAIALVITDMMMPVMGGAATIEALREENPDVRVIAVSGLSSREKLSFSVPRGVEKFLNKPYTAETLLKCLKGILHT